MIIHIILDPEQMEVVFMTPSKVAFSKHIAGLRDEMIEDDMIEEDGDYSDADLLEMYVTGTTILTTLTFQKVGRRVIDDGC